MRSTGLIILTLGIAMGCSKDRREPKIQYMPDMADAPTVKPQEDFLDPPDNSVSTNAIIYPADPAVAEEEFRNPEPRNDDTIAQGKVLYDTYCAVCHGPGGKGDGTLTDAYPKASVPDISRADLAEKKDGFFFLKISKGGPMMPAYGHATNRDERWKIVSYLRKLQGKG